MIHDEPSTQDSLFEVDRGTDPVWPDRPRVLMSYAYAKTFTADDFAEIAHADIIADSGAFTASNSGKPIDHDAYLAWLLEHAHSVRFAFSLDEIGDPDTSTLNYLYGRHHLEDRVQLVPTWHIGSPWSVLEKYCTETDYVSVGGAVKAFRAKTSLLRVCRRAHDIAKHHGTKLHGLGLTGFRVMRWLPWASVDSSSWSISARLPYLYLADRNGRLKSLNYGRPIAEPYRALVRQYGGDPEGMDVEGYALASHVGEELAATRRMWGVTASARSYMYAEAAKRGADPEASDFRVYLAAPPKDTAVITAAHALGDPWTPPTTIEENT